jgi:carbonic anhydrase
MSQQINISRENIEGKCDLKCSYNFVYKEYSSTANNMGSVIMIRPQETGDAPVTFDKKKYRVFWTLLYTPSRHLYNGNLADAELLIAHAPENGGKYLNVFIPLRSSSETNSGTTIITEIINKVSSSAPAQGDSVNIGGLNLQKIVPNKPFINYDSDSTNNIVFTMLDAIPISSTSLDTLKQLLKTNTEIASGGGLFYNSSGPNTTKELGDGIYISCNPTGSSTETTEVSYEKEDTTLNLTKILENPIFLTIIQVFFACLIFIVVCFIWTYGFSFIDGEHASKVANAPAN